MYSMAVNVGRLLEVRIASPVSVEEVAQFREELGRIFAAQTKPVAIVVELLRANVFPAEVAQEFLAVMRADNPRIERSALMCGESALFSMQVERLVREANSPRRRAFYDRKELEAWLGEVLTPPEATRLSSFLARQA